MNTEGMDIEQVIDALKALQAQDIRTIFVMPWSVKVTAVYGKMGEAIIETDYAVENSDDDDE